MRWVLLFGACRRESTCRMTTHALPEWGMTEPELQSCPLNQA